MQGGTTFFVEPACLNDFARAIIQCCECTRKTISMHHINRYPGRPYNAATDLRNPDFAAWARSFGGEGVVIGSEAEVGPKIAQAFAVKDRPVVVHVHSSAEQMSAWRRKN